MSSVSPLPQRLNGTLLANRPTSGPLADFAAGLTQVLEGRGHVILAEGAENPRLVINFTDAAKPRPYRRRAQGTFVVSVMEVAERPEHILKAAYPLLIRSLSNLLIYHVSGQETYFITLEQGYYTVDLSDLEAVYSRLMPLATSQLVVNNQFTPDLPEPLWQGNGRTRALTWAGQLMGQMNLLPAPFPINELLPPRDQAHLRRLFGIGGLSYGNLSVRESGDSFWMSASGVDKAKMQVIGRDMLLITGYDAAEKAMRVSVPPGVEPRRASVDAIEHWMIYTEHPKVGAIIHVHAWLDGVKATTVNYPCGTAELAKEVAQLVREAPEPHRAVIGLKNHGLTITGTSLADIFERIAGRLLPQVPMA